MNENLIELIALLMLELESNEILLDLDELSKLSGKQVKINHDWENNSVQLVIEDEVIAIDEELAQVLTVDEDEEVTEEQPN